MDELYYGVGQLVIGAAFLAGGVALVVRVPALGSLIAVTLLLMWGAVAVLAPIWAVGKHLADGNPVAALFCVAIALGMGYLWGIMGWPPLLELLSSRRHWRLRRDPKTDW